MKSPIWNLAAIVALFATPFLAAWYLYFGDYRPEIDVAGSVYRQPSALPEALSLRDADGALVALDGTGKWLLLQSVDSPCLDECRDELALVNAVHSRLHKNALRVSHALLGYQGDPPLPETIGILAIEPGDDGLMREWLHNPDQPDARVWIIDPRGFTAISYARPLRAADIYSDLKSLLSTSR